eukprot:PITA_26822
MGRSGGLALGYNPTSIKLESSWGGQGFLGADIYCSDLGSPLRIVNIYGTCHHREIFWRNLLSRNLLSIDHTIIGGDLNFSIGYSESWGGAAQIDPITDYISGLLEHHDFIDIPVQKPQPTWRNRRTGDVALARRLDRFLMKGPLIHRLQSFKQWVCTGGISDHHPIAMEIFGPHQKPKAPYKFNHLWLQDPSFSGLVTSYWNAHPIDREPSFSRGFVKNLTELKHLVINWAKEKKKIEDERLTKIENDLADLLDERNLGFISQEDKNKLVDLENQKNIILKGREESIRLHSRATWLKAGDENSRFFHNFAKGRKVANTIWNLPMPEGGMADTFNKLSNLGTSHFRNLYKNPAGTNLAEIINVAGHFPRFIEEDDAEDLEAPVTMAELESTIKWFKKEKSLGPDGWTIEFYATFFELLGEEILKVVEESRTTGSIYHAINSTFIALIPKTDHPSTFDEFRPISLCNVLYKIISKIIANRIKPILSRHISPQQFAFLEDRQIHEAIGSAQEAIHAIWTKHLRCILLKIDLSKAFDRGCPLSPLLFLLVIEALSRLLITANREGTIRGLKISDICYLTHLLFVDDVLILLDGSVHDTTSFSHILALFSKATGMEVNAAKSSITMTGTSVNESHTANMAFPYSTQPLERGLKYLGYWLKPTSQKITDWVWLVSKIEKRLSCWSHRYLSRAGRLILIKSVLEATPVFWMAMAWIPRNILAKLQQLCNRYLWTGHQDKRTFAWIGWHKIALPKKWGGWGLKELPSFAMALAGKMGWALLTSQSLWTKITYHKYIWPLSILDWARLPRWNKTGISSIWKALLLSLPLIRDNLVWRIRAGNKARIGLDPWSGYGGRHMLPQELIKYLSAHNIKVISQIADPDHTDIFHQAWKSAIQLSLPQRWHTTWDEYREALMESHIHITEGPDELIWHKVDHGVYTPKDGYIHLIEGKKPTDCASWWQSLWKLSASPRSRLFSWCLLRNKVPTGDQLMKRAFHGPTWCVFCKADSESIVHLFLQCRATRSVWCNIKPHINYAGEWSGLDMIRAWTDWGKNKNGSKMINLPIIVNWAIWKSRNNIIFENKPIHWPLLEASIIAALRELPDPPPQNARLPGPPPPIDSSKPWAFFDGAANTHSCGGGFILHLNENHHFRIKAGLGAGTNNFAELITLRHLLHFALRHHCANINIYGDSQIIINWINGSATCHMHSLSTILHDALELKSAFNHISISQIYREHNRSADKLSKEAALMDRGIWEIKDIINQQEHTFYHRPYIDPGYPTLDQRAAP